MTLSFSQKYPKKMGEKYAGKPNHFVEKIWTGLIHEIDGISINDYETYGLRHRTLLGRDMSEYDQLIINPKLHTLREDPHNRWKVGMKIHPVINNRTKDRFQFAPTMVCKGVQKVEITHSKFNPGIVWVVIDGFSFYEGPTYNIYNRRITELAVNDGFDSVEQFFAWFNTDWKGSMIHWTPLKY